MGLKALLLVIAIILFVMQAVGISFGRISPGWAGMAFFAASFLL